MKKLSVRKEKWKYFKITGRLFYGMVIKTKGREQQTYVFGESVWQKTWILSLYLTDDDDQYEEITKEQADEMLGETDELYHKLEFICMEKLRKRNIPAPVLQSKNLEIRIIYVLYYMSKFNKPDMAELEKEGFPFGMLWVLGILMDNGRMENNEQMEAILNNTMAMLVKNEDIFQSGQKTERDRKIIEKKIRYDNLVRL